MSLIPASTPVDRLDLTSRAGASSVLATLVCTPLFLIMIGLALYFGRAYHAKFALEEASASGARFAQTSLGEGRACAQTLAVMQRALTGYALSPHKAALIVRPTGGELRRVRQIEVRASYTVDQSAIPIFGRLLGDSEIRARFVVPVDPNISRQRYGWSACKTKQLKTGQ